MPKRLISLFIVVLFANFPAEAWNNTGHMAVARIAYLNLSTDPANNIRAKVDALLTHHPDFTTLSKGIAANDPNRGLIIFMRAATWPDLIKDDSRFVEGDEPSPSDPTPLPGFPSMIRGRNWHFINVPFSSDGTPTKPPKPINALVKIVEFRSAIGNSAVQPNIQAYDLSWLLHLVGDIHQPLHSIARFTTAHPNGDRGGNEVKLSDGSNLHTFWDDVLGSSEATQFIINLAKGITDETKPGDQGEIIIQNDAAAEQAIGLWITESAALAKYFVYTIGKDVIGDPKPSITARYQAVAKLIARHRIAVGGYRLAAILNDRLK